MESRHSIGRDLFSDALVRPLDAIAYAVSRELAASRPDKAILGGNACSFDIETYAAGGGCTLEPAEEIFTHVSTGWHGPRMGLAQHAVNAWYRAEWREQSLDVLLMTWTEGFQPQRHYWVLADSASVAEQFYLEVCEWCAEVRGEVLVFDGGHWQKSEELYHAIKDATFENLILRGSLKQEIRDDLSRFFASRPMYEEYGVPWKRGILFIGPPGNGKTHAVKALINSISQPCLYVKSFRSEFQTDHDSIRAVFQRARQTTPCILVLEDLDSLVDSQNRSFFLNELDGFASNAGIVTLATTNHPERLDPAILDRPSRFDRKYHFELPGPEERRAYVSWWNSVLKPALRLSEDTIARVVERTEEFSFAYIKELFLSATMRWITHAEEGGMEAVILAQADALREQMSSMNEETEADYQADDEAPSRQMMHAMMLRRYAAGRRRLGG